MKTQITDAQLSASLTAARRRNARNLPCCPVCGDALPCHPRDRRVVRAFGVEIVTCGKASCEQKAEG